MHRAILIYARQELRVTDLLALARRVLADGGAGALLNISAENYADIANYWPKS